ncbi:DUF4397 domain-containing protein [Idiomarina xiamenensis]|uniref:DUF4397 domain-containing protein n=1 Tax=Idiomarina xiamenensis 10-D-4 TaxID=740709 RepID=K2KFQ0_9GAMM|nr:DUF4397 domain-containing protein [Idiomarina xiamenensis]EKE81489.1 hypothetical protein A10D4_10441 [Idiomarina xiamenensis 10-D-4]
MNRITKLALIGLFTLPLAACDWFDGDDDDDVVVEPDQAAVRVHHAVADAPNVNVANNDDVVVEDAAYQGVSGYQVLDVGDYSVSVDAILPDNTSTTVIGPVDVSLAAEMRYDVFAIGSVADESLEAYTLSYASSTIADDTANVYIVHAAYDVPTVDIYVTEPSADLSAAAVTATLSYGEDSGLIEVPEGNYQVRITAAGGSDVLYDSGSLEIDGGEPTVIAATNNVNAGETPVSLVVSDDDDSMVVYDVNAGSDVRVVHAAADAPNVDIFVDNAADAAITDLAFGEASDYLNISADDHLIDVNQSGGAAVLNDVEVTTELAAQYSVYAIGSVANDDLGLAVLTEMTRRIATQGQLQVVHASPAAGNVDVYITSDGNVAGLEPALADIAFDASDLYSSGNVAIAAGDYQIVVTEAGTENVLIGPLEVTIENGGLYTVVAVDADGGGTPAGVILLDDLAPIL